jgi:hypothetical protein
MTMMTAGNAPRSMLGRFGGWWRRWREHAATLAGLRDCGDAELSRVAHDIGIGAYDLRVLAGKWPDAADLVVRRAAVLGLDAVELEREQPQVRRDLERVCSLCDNKRACEHDLSRSPAKADWRDYCPNAGTLAAISANRAQKVH